MPAQPAKQGRAAKKPRGTRILPLVSDEWLDGLIVSEILGLVPAEVRARAKKGELFPVLPINSRRFLVRSSDIDAWERSNTVGCTSRQPGLSSAARCLQRQRSAPVDHSPVLGPRPLEGGNGQQAAASLR